MTAASILPTTGLFGSEDGPHIALSPEAIFKVGNFTITNSMIYGVICSIGLLVLAIYARRKIGLKASRGISVFFEMIIDFIIGLIEGPLGSREKAVKYAPIFATFFVFITFNNLMGLLPIVGPGIYASTSEGITPLFRPFTADLNGTIAMSVIAIIVVQYLSIKESGFIGHLKHYFTDKPLNPINAFIGLLEVFGELTRITSLSLRLFLNTVVGEILISVFAYIGRDFRSFTILPIAVFEMMVALIQAYVFTMLCATYLGLAISHGHEGESSDAQHSVAELNEVKASG